LPRITSREIGFALDMHGCPNRCRHCYLGCPPNGDLTEHDLRWAAWLFRDYVKPGEDRPFIERLTVSSWYREPDYSDDYARLNVTLDETRSIPHGLVESTRKHFGREKLWETEAEIIARALNGPDGSGPVYGCPQPKLWFLVQGNWDVFPNMGTYTASWKLGNLKVDPVAEIIARFEHDNIPALRANATISVADLARRYGDPNSQLVDIGFAEHWLERCCACN
jgi:hypothetical protein